MASAVIRNLPLATMTVLLVLLAGCTAIPQPPTPVPTPPVPPAPAPPEERAWADLPLAPGGWTYRIEPGGSSARFGLPGTVALAIHCDKAARRIGFTPTASAPGNITITTSYGGRDLPLVAGASGGLEASLPAADPFLDRIAFSRGRVSYAVPERPLLMTPAWAEPARVIEDCRG